MAIKILILGANGQLGRELARTDWAFGAPLSLSRTDADLTVPGLIEHIIEDIRPGLVINAAAYTAVDRAESESNQAFTVNAWAPGRIAAATAMLGVPLVHVSTDYVFDGAKKTPYVETDPIAPLGVYGASKAEGEARVRDANPRHIILRTSWVYSSFGQNFVRTMLRLAQERGEIRVVNDQIGAPTAAGDLAAAIRSIAATLLAANVPFGTYHLTGQGATSWYGFADAIFEDMKARAGRRPRLVPIATNEYPTTVARPANSRLDNTKFQSAFGFLLPPWQDSLGAVLETLHGK